MHDRDELLRLFAELQELTALEDGGRASFRARAFERAAEVIKTFGEDLSKKTPSQLKRVEGLGASSAAIISEYFSRGKVARLEELRAQYPREFVDLTRVPGLGPKLATRLRDELGVDDVAKLRQALDAGRVQKLSGFGQALSEKLRHGLERVGGKVMRRPIAEVLPFAEAIVRDLAALPEVSRAQYAGSLRRRRETIADVDVIAETDSPKAVQSFFVSMPRVENVITRGRGIASVAISGGLQVDLRTCSRDEFGAMLLYFTGSKAHNIKLRVRAHELDLSLNEHGLFTRDKETLIVASTEAEIYDELGLSNIPPPMRQDLGEVEAAAERRLPVLTEVSDLRGDLHMHCDFSRDAKSSVDEMVEAAVERGYQYLAISDHAENLRLNGVSFDDHKRLREKIERLRQHFPEILVLHGCELNIGRDGSLDYTLEERGFFDICLASVHSHFQLGEAEQTERLIRAMEEPRVRILGHMLGRSIGKRPGIEVNVDEVLEAAVENDVAIEINSGLKRLDPPSEILRRAVEKNCLFAINSDAHAASHLEGVRFGVEHSHAGWIPRGRVVNTWERERFEEWLREPFE